MSTKPILIVAPSRKTRGGITAVVSAYESSWIWKFWNCVWIETHLDRNVFTKVCYLICSLMVYIYWLPRCRLVHIHLSEPISAIRKSLFAVLALLLKKPIILHFHSFSPATTINSKWRPLYKFLFSRAKAVLVLSPYWEKAITQSLGEISVVVVPNPCPKILDRAPHVHSRPYVLFAGTLNARKGYSDLIEAFALLTKKYPDWDLVLAGNGEIQRATILAKRLGIESRVKLLGWISNESKVKQFTNAEIFCLPSYAEGFPMAILDAMAYGLPIVATPVGGIPDALENNKSALIVEPGDIQNLAKSLGVLMSSQKTRIQLSQASIELANSNFSLDEIVKKIDKLYARFAA